MRLLPLAGAKALCNRREGRASGSPSPRTAEMGVQQSSSYAADEEHQDAPLPQAAAAAAAAEEEEGASSQVPPSLEDITVIDINALNSRLHHQQRQIQCATVLLIGKVRRTTSIARSMSHWADDHPITSSDNECR